MKLNYGLVLVAFLAAVILWPVQEARAQSDTLTVEWGDAQGFPIKNALRNAILGDTVAGGARANLNRVYKLKKGGFYWNTERIENNGFHLRLVGEPSGATALDNPPVLQMVVRADGTADGRMITGQNNVTLKNLWLTGRDDNGVQTYYQPIQIDASNARITVDNCILEYTNFALIAFTGSNNDIFFTNNKFRNLIGQPSTQQWEGRGISVWADQDTILVENNTFFNLGFMAFQIEGGAAKYLRFNHNTLFNVGRSIQAGNWWREAYFANNLMVNIGWHGEGSSDFGVGRNPRSNFAGIWSIGALPSKYGPEEGRRIALANNAAYRDPFFATKYADTIRAQTYYNKITKEDFVDKYDQIVVVDTLWLSAMPNFPTTNSQAALDSMWSNITMLRASLTPATRYFFQPTQFPTDVAWPLAENFSYTTPANLLTAGTDGLPLGDLNWFPTQKAQWDANGGYIWSVEKQAGARTILEPVTTVEAEDGTVGGSAAVVQFTGDAWYRVAPGSSVQWSFNAGVAGPVDMTIRARMESGAIGFNFFLNGSEIHDKLGWGEFVFWNGSDQVNKWNGLGDGAFHEVKYTQADINEAGALQLVAGTNTVKLENQWNDISFARIDFHQAGTSNLVASLTSAAAVNNGATPGGLGTWVPQGFKSVSMGANGNINWTFNAPSAGNYKLQIYYQNVSGAQTGQVMVAGGGTASVNFIGNTDSTGLGALSNAFPLTAGSHTITLSASNIKVDFVQLNKETITGVEGGGDLPVVYSLDQNYPNPFNPSTIIRYAIPTDSKVELKVYDMLGREVATLVNGFQNAGSYNIDFNARHLSTGLYFYRISAGSFTQVKKMTLVK